MASSPAAAAASPVPAGKKALAPLWISNSIFFIGMHLMALVGVLHPRLSPWYDVDRRTLLLCFVSWQLAIYGITIGYHRLWSHKSFTASFPLRVVLAGMGCLGFQGSIRWWVLRHRLHHAFTDTDSDPYNALDGLYHSHMGWIFRKPSYPRMALVDKKDLNADPVVRFQHKYYIPLSLGLGLVLPTLIGASYGDAMGGYIWGGIVARLMIWHCTFCINSLAHYLGDQEYSMDVTARGNFLLAVFTGGEANHNFHHAYPSDYRNGPRALDWDPTKWAIYLLHNFTPFVPRVQLTPPSDILKARAHVLSLQSDSARESETTTTDHSLSRWSVYANAGATSSGDSSSAGGYGSSSSVSSDDDDSLLQNEVEVDKGLRKRPRGLPTWTSKELIERCGSGEGRKPIVLFLEGYAVDVTEYAKLHPGGMAVLMRHAVRPAGEGKEGEVVDSSEAFGGGLNNHGWSANEKMRGMRIARVVGA